MSTAAYTWRLATSGLSRVLSAPVSEREHVFLMRALIGLLGYHPIDDAVCYGALLLGGVAEGHGGDEPLLLFRSMMVDEDGLPLARPTARTLGARPGIDVPVDTAGLVRPGTGGMSVSPNDARNLPRHRLPAELGGTGKDPVWCIGAEALGPQISYRPDPANPERHGFVEPARRMALEEYRLALERTRERWLLVAS